MVKDPERRLLIGRTTTLIFWELASVVKPAV